MGGRRESGGVEGEKKGYVESYNHTKHDFRQQKYDLLEFLNWKLQKKAQPVPTMTLVLISGGVS